MVTLMDVAREVGTSVSTVSRVVRNSGYVNDELRERIQQTCERLGYIPNSNAKKLRNGKSNTIGIIVSDINNYFYNITLGHMVNSFRENNYQVQIGYSYENDRIEMEVLEMLLANRVDAIIMTPVSDQNKRLIDTIKKRDIPIVQLYRRAYKGIDSICVDDSYGAYLAANHLFNKGNKRIGLLSINIKFTPHRSEGYKRAYKEHNVQLEEDLILKLPPNASTEDEIKRFIIKNNPDAIIAGTNLLGIDTLKVIKSLKIKHLNESHLVVFDDMPWMELLDVSAISQPIELLSQKCVDTVLTALTDESIPKVIEEKVVPRLVVRNKQSDLAL